MTSPPSSGAAVPARRGSSALARRYAAACFAVARDRNVVDEVGRGLDEAAKLVDDPRVQAALSNPRVTVSERLELVLGALSAAHLPQEVRNLVHLLVSRGRSHLVAAVAAEYAALREEATGVLRAVVSSAVPLDAAAAGRIEQVLSRTWGRPVQVEAEHDPAIIGGLVVRVGDRVIDDSIRTHLQQLQAAMA
jgi:F-type H+-transporting ATPase subunit delta